jgi:histidyl-tRNA synthetase
MRYERPGKGRLREFYQLNVDLIGDNSIYADVEILSIAMDLLKCYGAKEDQFVVKFSHRALLDLWLDIPDKEKLRQIGRIIDKKEKISQEQFNKEIKQICNEDEFNLIHHFLNLKLELDKNGFLKDLPLKNKEQIKEIFNHLKSIFKYLSVNHNTNNVQFDPSIVRGFDYYTGLIFEIYDTHPENKRAIFGGGRYDNLIGQFSKESLPAIGFGMGDVTLEEFLKNHQLIPEIKNKIGFYFTLFDESLYSEYLRLIQLLRNRSIPVETSLSRPKKFGKEFEIAEKKGYLYAIILGEDELKNHQIKIKNLKTGKQFNLSFKDEKKLIEELQSLLEEIK